MHILKTINQWVAYLRADKAQLHIKGMKWVVREGRENADIATYTLYHVGLFVDSHPKFTCQTQ